MPLGVFHGILSATAAPEELRRKFVAILPYPEERARQHVAATEARQLGHGGLALVGRACGLSRLTVAKGIPELAAPLLPPVQVRRPGAGRPRLSVHDPALPRRLEALGGAARPGGSRFTAALDGQEHLQLGPPAATTPG
jgi:hypothetical protein